MAKVKFCPECGSLLRKGTKKGQKYLICKCGYQEPLKVDEKERQKTIEKKKKEIRENTVVIKKEDRVSVHPEVTKECPRCDNNKAEAWQEQTRSADEASTSFFRCTKCKKTWREY
ncbi:MAG: transcription factor S [Promethearchaeia archaeon]